MTEEEIQEAFKAYEKQLESNYDDLEDLLTDDEIEELEEIIKGRTYKKLTTELDTKLKDINPDDEFHQFLTKLNPDQKEEENLSGETLEELVEDEAKMKTIYDSLDFDEDYSQDDLTNNIGEVVKDRDITVLSKEFQEAARNFCGKQSSEQEEETRYLFDRLKELTEGGRALNTIFGDFLNYGGQKLGLIKVKKDKKKTKKK